MNATKPTVIVLRETDALWSEEALPDVLAAAEALHGAIRSRGYAVAPMPLESPQHLPRLLKRFAPQSALVFNWFEGAEWGAEDMAEVTATLDNLGYAYSGSGTATMLMTQDKTRAKNVLRAAGIPTPASWPVLGDTWATWGQYPAIIKVASEHGSESISTRSVVRSRRALRARIEELSAVHGRLMVSEFIDGREFCVSLLGNAEPQVLPLVEIDFADLPPALPRVRTFESKFDAGSPSSRQIKTVCPPRLPRALQRQIEAVALRTYHNFGMRDYGRIDIRLRGDSPEVIDVNPNPDITAGASFVISAAAAGHDYAAMIEQIILVALERTGRDASDRARRASAA